MGVLTWLVAPAIADDVLEPEWRGEWSTTTQIWEFLEPITGDYGGYTYGTPGNMDGTFPWQGGVTPNGPGPLIEGNYGEPYNPGYLPSTMLWVYPESDWIEMDQESGRVGIWPLSGRMEVVVDNHNPPNPFKWVRMQLTWRPQAAGTVPEPIIGNLMPEPNLPDDMVKEIALIDHMDGWVTSVYEWYLRPNPPDEWFTISGDIDVDQLVVDTWCIPEPGTLAMLLGIGLILLGYRRKR